MSSLQGHRQPSLDVGEEVVAKNRQGKYCRGVVCQIRNANFYKVNFRDNSWSDNLYQQDIVVSTKNKFVVVFLFLDKKVRCSEFSLIS